MFLDRREHGFGRESFENDNSRAGEKRRQKTAVESERVRQRHGDQHCVIGGETHDRFRPGMIGEGQARHD